VSLPCHSLWKSKVRVCRRIDATNPQCASFDPTCLSRINSWSTSRSSFGSRTVGPTRNRPATDHPLTALVCQRSPPGRDDVACLDLRVTRLRVRLIRCNDAKDLQLGSTATIKGACLSKMSLPQGAPRRLMTSRARSRGFGIIAATDDRGTSCGCGATVRRANLCLKDKEPLLNPCAENGRHSDSVRTGREVRAEEEVVQIF
jgi:hypothetical protein